MNKEKFINYNNELRKQLNEENNKKYEELLVKIRLLSFFKDDKKTEEILLEMLQDLIDYQHAGKSFEDIYGADLDKIAKDIIANTPTISFKKSIGLILMIIFMFYAPSLFINISFSEKFNITKYLVSGGFTLVLATISLLILIYSLPKIHSILGFIISAILMGTSMFLPMYLFQISDIGAKFIPTNEITITTPILIGTFTFALLCIVAAGEIFKQRKIFYSLSFPILTVAILVILKNNNILDTNSTSGKFVLIFTLFTSLILTLLLPILVSKQKKDS